MGVTWRELNSGIAAHHTHRCVCMCVCVCVRAHVFLFYFSLRLFFFFFFAAVQNNLLCRSFYQNWWRQMGVTQWGLSSGIAAQHTCPTPFTPFCKLAAVLRLQRTSPSLPCGCHLDISHDALLHCHNTSEKGWWVFDFFSSWALGMGVCVCVYI